MVIQLWYEEKIRAVGQLWLYNYILPITSFIFFSDVPNTKYKST